MKILKQIQIFFTQTFALLCYLCYNHRKQMSFLSLKYKFKERRTPMTLKEIAQKAGVSISTVSRVINNQNSKAASKEVQDRIWQIVRETEVGS